MAPPSKRSRKESTNPKEGEKDKKSSNNNNNSNSNNRINEISEEDSLVWRSRITVSTDKLLSAYLEATPFPHGWIPDLFHGDEGLLDGVLEDLKHHCPMKFKESDLFRVYQSMDFGNLTEESEWPQKTPHLMKLKRILYGTTFRSFMETISGLPPGTLTDRVDCAANCHAPGCHLLCHDDVIGTRRISFILYLTDRQWDMETDGGALELYATTECCHDNNDDKMYEPIATPTRRLSPSFGALAYFEVRPGVSYHSVGEVVGDRPRTAIQGWFHAKEAPEGVERSTRIRLTTTRTCRINQDTDANAPDDAMGFVPYDETSSHQHEKGEEDVYKCLSELKPFVNPTYLDPVSIRDICQRFEDESSILLHDFVKEECIPNVSNDDDNDDNDWWKNSSSPQRNDWPWQVVGPPHLRRHLCLQEEKNDSSLKKKFRTLSKVMRSWAFRSYLTLLTGLHPLRRRGAVRVFRPGHDYTVAHHDGLMDRRVLDATLCFVGSNQNSQGNNPETNDNNNNNNEEEEDEWESGDIGGFECYVAAEENDEAAETYEDNDNDNHNDDNDNDDDDDGPLLSVSAGQNTLSLVFRDPGTLKFVKYVSGRAPGPRWDVAYEYDLGDDDDINDNNNDDNHVEDDDDNNHDNTSNDNI